VSEGEDQVQSVSGIAQIRGVVYTGRMETELSGHSPTRRQFVVATSTWVTAGLAGATFADEEKTAKEKPAVRFGIVTDLHYADKKSVGSRFYRESKAKLTEAVALFKEQKPDFVVELGDLVDAASTVALETEYLKTIDAVFKTAGCPLHYVFGNHCLATLTKDEFLKVTGAEKGYYSFDQGGIHFVVLDACFNSKMEPYARGNFSWSDANLPQEEREWLAKDLSKTKNKTVIFVHQRLDKDTSAHRVQNCSQVRKILEDAGNVLAVFQGHSHTDELEVVNDIRYATLAAMVEGQGAENNSYGMVEVYPTGAVRLDGYRKLTDRSFG
jgi:predicted phosphodiesterase